MRNENHQKGEIIDIAIRHTYTARVTTAQTWIVNGNCHPACE